MDQNECLEAIAGGEMDATDLLIQANPKFKSRFNRIDKALIEFLADVRKHFPDACYYTGSGGFNLMIGASHANDRTLTSQQELVALSGSATIGDGDW